MSRHPTPAAPPTTRTRWIAVLLVTGVIAAVVGITVGVATRPVPPQATVARVPGAAPPSVTPTATATAIPTPTALPVPSATAMPTPPPIVVTATATAHVVDHGALVTQIRGLLRVESVDYATERVVEVNRLSHTLQDLWSGDRLMLIAAGRVIAGVDMRKLAPADVMTDPRASSITVRLPPTEVFIVALDSDTTRVYDRQTGIGSRVFDTAALSALEREARVAGEAQILAAACDEHHIMQRAADTVTTELENFLYGLGFAHVTVHATAGRCTPPAAPDLTRLTPAPHTPATAP